jgi:hypothetical protein
MPTNKIQRLQDLENEDIILRDYSKKKNINSRQFALALDTLYIKYIKYKMHMSFYIYIVFIITIEG